MGGDKKVPVPLSKGPPFINDLLFSLSPLILGTSPGLALVGSFYTCSLLFLSPRLEVAMASRETGCLSVLGVSPVLTIVCGGGYEWQCLLVSREGCQASSSISLHFIPLSQVLSLNLKLKVSRLGWWLPCPSNPLVSIHFPPHTHQC